MGWGGGGPTPFPFTRVGGGKNGVKERVEKRIREREKERKKERKKEREREEGQVTGQVTGRRLGKQATIRTVAKRLVVGMKRRNGSTVSNFCAIFFCFGRDSLSFLFCFFFLFCLFVPSCHHLVLAPMPKPFKGPPLLSSPADCFAIIFKSSFLIVRMLSGCQNVAKQSALFVFLSQDLPRNDSVFFFGQAPSSRFRSNSLFLQFWIVQRIVLFNQLPSRNQPS